MSDVKPRITALAKELKAGMKLGDGGVIEADKDLYEKTLPDDIDLDTAKKVYSHTEDLVAAQTLATSQIGEEAMKKNKKLDSVSSELKVGKHAEINVGYLRSQQQTIRNMQNPKEAPKQVTKYGVTTARVKTLGQKNRGELKKVKADIAARAESMFK
jgi:methyltransferase-like protein